MTNNGTTAPAAEDRGLVLAFQHGDGAAYRAIYERHHQRAIRVCRRMLNNPEDAKEAVQETFLRVYTGLGTFNGSYQLGAWITRIAANVCLDILKARSRRPLADLELAVVDTKKMCDEALNPETVILGRAERRRMGEVLRKLPPHQRAAIVLRDFEGLSYAEVAAALGISEAQTKALIHRARRAFKRTWQTRFLALVLPARWVDRLRRTPVEVEEKAGSLVTSASHATQTLAASPQVVSCASALQQCGQFVTERVAPALTAVVVGTAGAALVSGGAVRVIPEPPEVLERIVATEDSRQDPDLFDHGSDDVLEFAQDRVSVGDGAEVASESGVVAPDSAATPAAEEAPVGDPVPPEIAPTADPSPPPDTEPPDDPDPEPPDDPDPTVEPDPDPTTEPTPTEPQGLTFDFVADVGGNEPPCDCERSPLVSREAVEVSEERLDSFDQFMTGYGIDQGMARYEVRLEQAYGSGGHRMRFELETKNGDVYTYSAAGTLTSQEKTHWGGLAVRFSGTYEITARPGFDEPVPENGTYSLYAEFSVTRQRAVTISVVLD